jgi:hypothetical protein
MVWVGVSLVAAFLTPPGRFLLWLSQNIQEQGTVHVEMPVTSLKIWFILVPIFAFGPPAALIIAWLRAQGVRGGTT